MPVRINKKDYTFSPGSHNQLQKLFWKILRLALPQIQNASMLEIPHIKTWLRMKRN